MTAFQVAADVPSLFAHNVAPCIRHSKCSSTRRRLYLMHLSGRPARLAALSCSSHATHAAPSLPFGSKNTLLRKAKSQEAEIQVFLTDAGLVSATSIMHGISRSSSEMYFSLHTMITPESTKSFCYRSNHASPALLIKRSWLIPLRGRGFYLSWCFTGRNAAT